MPAGHSTFQAPLETLKIPGNRNVAMAKAIAFKRKKLLKECPPRGIRRNG
jgi:hypothetical protein